MNSNTRQQLEKWLHTLNIIGSVIDVGGSSLHVKGRTNTWDVDKYVVADVKKADFIWDFNQPLTVYDEYENVFCLEMMEYVYDPLTVAKNLRLLTRKGGRLFISTHFLFPHHSGGEDCLRYTRIGICKLLTKVGFEIVSITPRMAVDDSLPTALDLESKRQYHRGEIGHLIEATC